MYTISLHPGEPSDPNLKSRRYSAAEFRTYTDYVERVNNVFAEGERLARVAVLHPIVSLWAHFTPSERSMYELHPNDVVRLIDDGFAKLCRKLLENQIDYDIIDERSLADARIEDGKLVLGQMAYDLLVLPPMDTIRTRSMEKILQLVDDGGSVLAHPLFPKYAAEGPDKDRFIKMSAEKILAKGGFGGISVSTAPLLYLVKSRVPPMCMLSPSSPAILCTTISRKESRTHFLVNTSAEPYEGTCTFRSTGNANSFDPQSGKEEALSSRPVENKSSQTELRLDPFESRFVVFR
jgi:hypothetical protein